MSKRSWQSILGAGAAVLVATSSLFFIAGCSDDKSDRPSIAQLHDGVNLLEVKDPSWGVNAAFVKNNRVVYVQTRIGALKPDVYRQADANEPPYETDMRFVDGKGNTFYAQRGGDTFVDSSWDKEILHSRAKENLVAPEERDRDFRLAKDAATALAIALPASFKDHTFHIAHYATLPIPSEDASMQERAQRIATKRQAETGFGQTSFMGSEYLDTQLYAHQICAVWICPAWHSSTIMWNYVSSWNQAIVACNHGACGGNGNSYQCESAGGWYASPTINGESSSSNGGAWGACLSGYNWDTPPGHECNSDSAYEMWQAKSGNMNTPYGGQWTFNWNDPNGHNYQCSTGSGGGNGDWKKPACP
jgi:hypothetical protein